MLPRRRNRKIRFRSTLETARDATTTDGDKNSSETWILLCSLARDYLVAMRSVAALLETGRTENAGRVRAAVAGARAPNKKKKE